MSKIAVISPTKARTATPPPYCSGLDHATIYLAGDRDPLHLYLLDIAARTLHLAHSDVDRAIYVWRGQVGVGQHALNAGSSIIVEHGRTLTIEGGSKNTLVLMFAAADASAQTRAGGHVHVLPAERVPRASPTPGSTGVAGGLHADSACPTCQVWLHENTFPGTPAASAEDQARGVHAHTEDEIIFVTDGEMRLGKRLYGPGTALAVAANTMYGFTAGPNGLRFVNFRCSMPGDIRFAQGGTMSETGYWRERVPRPQYLEL